MFGWSNAEKITDILYKTDSKKEFEKLLGDLLTTNEVDEIAQRIKIFEMLNRGKSQRYIAEKLDISITTVTRGSKALQDKKSVIKKYL